MHRFAVGRTQEMKRAEQNENDALYQRRLRVLEAELEGRRLTVRERLETARHRGRGERVVRMFEAQLVRAEARHAEERGRLQASRKVDVELSEPLACCVIDLHVTDAGQSAPSVEARK
jgi:hypothetical protein